MSLKADILLLLPEIFMLISASGILLVDVYTQQSSRLLTYRLSQSALVLTAFSVIALWPQQSSTAFSNSFISDLMSAGLKCFILVITMFVFLYFREYLKKHECLRGEYFILGLFAVLGMMIMVSANSLLTIYLGLELLSLSLYTMVAMQKDSPVASEAATKYFVLGALASGILLYGMSMLYGVTGSLELATISEYVADSQDNTLLVFGLVFIVVGLAFKLGAVPFHMWVPDVYQGALTPVTLFIASAPKLAAFAMTIRLLVNGLQPLSDDWQGMLIILAVLSMAIGNIVAISQSNIKRMLAYSTIAHIGYLLLGIIAANAAGYAGAMFYSISYAIMSMGAFAMIILLSRKDFASDKLSDFKGLAERNHWFAFIMLILMFSMAGVPPFLGFWAKWFVLKELVGAGFIALAVLAVVFSIIGAYYYLNIIKLMYFDGTDSMVAIKASTQMRFTLSVNGLLLLALGLVPDILLAFCTDIFSKIL